MRVKFLFIGGTRFVGKAMVEAALNRGHEVAVFHRGKTPINLPVQQLIGDRTKDFTALQTGEWDVVIDTCGYRPHEIHALYDALAGRIKKYVFISTVSAYSNSIPYNADESAELAPTEKVLEGNPISMEIDGHTYGPLKVLCEEAVVLHYPDALIIRPTYVIGADDYTLRFPKWVEKFRDNNTVQCPNPPDAPMQYIDSRDLAELTFLAIEQNVSGPLNATGIAPGFTWEQFLTQARDEVNPKCRIEWVDANPDDDYPLWTGDEHISMLAVDNSRAIKIGLQPRPLGDSAKATLEWCNRK